VLYSCFDDQAGNYRVYEHRGERAVNDDLPVPKLPSDVSGIGVPAIEAGRPLPKGARYVGRSWQAKGIVVRCGGELGTLEETLDKAFGRSLNLVSLSVSALVGYWLTAKLLGGKS
jgi:hypothetical protein